MSYVLGITRLLKINNIYRPVDVCTLDKGIIGG